MRVGKTLLDYPLSRFINTIKSKAKQSTTMKQTHISLTVNVFNTVLQIWPLSNSSIYLNFICLVSFIRYSFAEIHFRWNICVDDDLATGKFVISPFAMPWNLCGFSKRNVFKIRFTKRTNLFFCTQPIQFTTWNGQFFNFHHRNF